MNTIRITYEIFRKKFSLSLSVTVSIQMGEPYSFEHYGAKQYS